MCPPMARIAVLYDLANERLAGRLAHHLRAWRNDEDLTIDQIVDVLRDREVEVSRETVRRWLRDLDGAAA